MTPYREAYTEAALEDILAIAAYLEARRKGLGKAFRNELDTVISTLLDFPESAPVVSDRGVRRRLLTRFPYTVLYVLRDDLLLVLAVAHTSRAPDYWRNRSD